MTATELLEILAKAEWALQQASEDLAAFEAGERRKRSVSTSTAIVTSLQAIRMARKLS